MSTSFAIPWIPTRLLCPWDFPGKNSGVGCHTFSRGSSQLKDLTCVSFTDTNGFFTCRATREAMSRRMCCAVLCLVVSNSLRPMDCSPPGSSVYEDSPGKNTWVGCQALLQGIFSTQGLNPGLLHCRWILYCLSHQGSPSIRILNFILFNLQCANILQ